MGCVLTLGTHEVNVHDLPSGPHHRLRYIAPRHLSQQIAQLRAGDIAQPPDQLLATSAVDVHAGHAGGVLRGCTRVAVREACSAAGPAKTPSMLLLGRLIWRSAPCHMATSPPSGALYFSTESKDDSLKKYASELLELQLHRRREYATRRIVVREVRLTVRLLSRGVSNRKHRNETP